MSDMVNVWPKTSWKKIDECQFGQLVRVQSSGKWHFGVVGQQYGAGTDLLIFEYDQNQAISPKLTNYTSGKCMAFDAQPRIKFEANTDIIDAGKDDFRAGQLVLNDDGYFITARIDPHRNYGNVLFDLRSGQTITEEYQGVVISNWRLSINGEGGCDEEVIADISV